MCNPFPILTAERADDVRGWTGANPYGMVRLTLSEHVILRWATESSEYVSTGDGAWSALVELNPDDGAFLALVDAVDRSYATYGYPPAREWTYPPAGSGDEYPAGALALLVDVDDRGWPSWSVETAERAAERWDGFLASLPADEDED